MTASLGILVAAGGASRRFGGSPKLLAPLRGRPLFCHCLLTFAAAFPEAPIIVAVPADLQERFRSAAAECLPEAAMAHVAFVVGGGTRTESVGLALEHLRAHAAVLPAYVAVHDAARPYVTAATVQRCLDALEADASLDGVLAGRPCTDTIHTVDEAGLLVGTPPRNALRTAETPQVFRIEILIKAYAAYAAHLPSSLPTDEADLVLRSGPCRLAVVVPEEANPKITYAADLP